MIKANELRIGNYLQMNELKEVKETRRIEFFNNPVKVLSLVFKSVMNEYSINYEYKNKETKEVESWSTRLKNESLTPIPLNEEWLLKFGFKKDCFGSWNYFIKKSTIYFSKIQIVPDYVYLRQGTQKKPHQDHLCTIHNRDIQGEIYVHQLQNLYFALTGEELTTKNKTK